jgi:hypothetical protein
VGLPDVSFEKFATELRRGAAGCGLAMVGVWEKKFLFEDRLR